MGYQYGKVNNFAMHSFIGMEFQGLGGIITRKWFPLESAKRATKANY